MEKSKHTVRRKHAEVEYHIVQHEPVRRVSSQIHSTDMGTAEFHICGVLLGCRLPDPLEPVRRRAAASKVNVSSRLAVRLGPFAG